MKLRLERLWAARSPREKLMVVAAALVAAGVAADTVLLAPQRVQRSALDRQLKNGRQQIEQLKSLAEEHSQQGDANLRHRVALIEARRARAEQVIRDAQVDLISPQEMVKQLAAILKRFPELRVRSLQSLPPTPLGEALDEKQAGSAAVRAASGLFQHGIEVVVEGRYLDVLAYLEALEKAPYRVYWRGLDLKVESSGVPVTRLTMFTLSRESVWLRI